MNRFLRAHLGNRKGQSAIEFIVVVVVLLFFLLFFLSLAILFVVSDYLEYATFMSARTYKAMVSDKDVQQRNAKLVFDKYAERVQGIARNYTLTFVEGDDRGDQGAGVRASYDIDLFYLPPLFIPEGFPGSRVTLSTETRLGRDPSYNECNGFFENFLSQFGIDNSIARQMDDNGC